MRWVVYIFAGLGFAFAFACFWSWLFVMWEQLTTCRECNQRIYGKR